MHSEIKKMIFVKYEYLSTIMKNISLGLNVILTIAVIILYYFHFTSNKTSEKPENTSNVIVKQNEEEKVTEEKEVTPSNIGYINLDTLQLNYGLYNDLLKKSKARQKKYTNEFSTKRTAFENKVQKFQQDAPTMTQFEGEMKQQELAKEQEELYQLEEQLTVKLQNEIVKMNNEIAVEIKDYIAKYNEEFGYDIIIGATQAGNIILYNKDDINLTTPVTEGLNEQYNLEKKK